MMIHQILVQVVVVITILTLTLTLIMILLWKYENIVVILLHIIKHYLFNLMKMPTKLKLMNWIG